MTALSLCLVLVLSLSAAAAERATGCATCTVRSQLKRFSLDHIKQQILTKLGLSAVPNITGRALPDVPPLQSFIDTYSMQSDQPGNPFRTGPSVLDEADDFTASIEKVFAFAQTQPKVRHRKGLETLNFKFSDRILGSKVIKALLWLHLRPIESTGLVVVAVRRELPPSSSSSAPYVSIKEMRNRPYDGKWISIDVKRFVAEWFKNPKDNMGLSVHTTVSGQTEHPQRIVDLLTQTDETSFVPFLEVHVSDPRKHRTKRTIGLNCDENMDEKRCCRYPLTVDFEDFGWDWIIAPKKYEANYCSGECPYVFLQKYAHTHIVSMASPAGSPGPCCAPRKMSSISMLYFDNELNIIYGLLPGMVVDRCGCS